MFWRIVIGALIIFFLVFWVRATIDAWKRGDLTNGAKAAWTLIMLIFPFIGLLLYTLIRPTDAEIAQRSGSRYG